ncbi:MAG: FixH family protein [Bacteroidota bacterium]
MKIKWNWGTKLAIWIIAFVVFMLTLVYMTTTTKINLVEEDYYPKGLVYQTRIDAAKNANSINAVFTTSQDDKSITINIPDIQVDSGTILFFRPSGNNLDRRYDLELNNNKKITLTKDDFNHGKYIMKINWNFDGKEYYVEQIFFVK